MAASKTIKNAVVSVLRTIKLNGEDAFTSVEGHNKGRFDNFPAIRVLPADQTSEKAAYGQNDRTVALTATVYLKSGNGSEFDYMYDLTDAIIDKLDAVDFQNSLQPQIGTYMLNTTRGDWSESDTQAGPVLACDVNIEVTYSKDN